MKVNYLHWKESLLLLAAGAVIFVYSCNNDKSEKNSTTSETDTTAGLNNNTVNNTSADTLTGSRSSRAKKGKVSVAITTANSTDKMVMDKAGYYNYAEVAPSYSGGQRSIEDYITNNIEYPQQAIDDNKGGTVNVQFGVDADGKISNVKAIGNKIGDGLEEEAVKVVSNMPKWNPGTVKGKNVKTWMVLPITFKIDE